MKTSNDKGIYEAEAVEESAQRRRSYSGRLVSEKEVKRAEWHVRLSGIQSACGLNLELLQGFIFFFLFNVTSLIGFNQLQLPCIELPYDVSVR
ncbi:hypothetical protein [Thermogemmatispora carboxidivorans]|uniref:hypothetical protein n=1 Tax=Thermogemmatispora carboxidivorans TaxID=1382306 RepID=UPI00069A9662|nr:hypothetical protein [Thermogemmatispora carboxidivorans]